MKRILSFFLTFCMLFGAVGLTASAEIIGQVIATDITAYIDEQPIESFNINDYTYVIAEDLRDYGFDVNWSEAQRSLRIYRKIDNQRWFMPAEKVNIKKSDVPRGSRVFDVYSTDIVTYMEDSPVNAYNVDGQTLVQIDELSRYGYFSYNDERREVKINMAAFDADSLYEQSAKESLSLPCDKIEGTITYSGDVENGQPNGYGRVTEQYEFTNGLASTDYYVYTAQFVNGEPNGPLYYYGKHIPYNGSDRRVREYYKFENYANGVLNGYNLQLTLLDSEPGYRTESIYQDGEISYSRITEYDAEYRYGYKVVQEGYLDALGNIIDYSQTEAGKIVSVNAGNDSGLVIDENGTLFGFGDTVFGKKTVPVKIDENVAFAAGDSAMVGSVIDGSGNLYYLYDKVVTYNNTDVPVAAQNVKAASDDFFLTNDGNLYIKPLDYNWTWYDQPTLLDTDVSAFSSHGRVILYQKSDGSVYYARITRPGTGWIDELDLSAPVKVFDNAKSISYNGRFLVVDENNALWGWSSQLYGTGYEGTVEDEIFTTKSPIKIADDVAYADNGSGFIAYIKTDGSLWAAPDATEPDGEMLFGLTEPVKLMDNVKTMSCGTGGYMLFVTEEGALYSWGENNYGRLGNGTAEDAQEPCLIENFYVIG